MNKPLGFENYFTKISMATLSIEMHGVVTSTIPSIVFLSYMLDMWEVGSQTVDSLMHGILSVSI
jgi:hypothetical protein